jgi:23S rRNA pseudouridine2605 synthase
MSSERIQKALSRQGLGSRRQIEAWISEGKITVNGHAAKLGEPVSAGDTVMFGGRRIVIREADQQLPKVIVYNKPEGEVCTRDDPEHRPTIFQRLPKLRQGRWITIGRLDINTSGLILLTDNGELANRLMHPSHQVEREYLVRVLGRADDDALYKLTHGVKLDDGMARFEDVVDSDPESNASNHWYYVVIMEGRKREVRRLWEAVGLKVSRLKRVRYGSVMLAKNHRQGQSKELTDKKVIELCEMVGLQYDLPESAAAGPKKTIKKKSHKPEARTAQRGRSQKNRRDKHDSK